MPHVIKHGRLVADDWTLVTDARRPTGAGDPPRRLAGPPRSPGGVARAGRPPDALLPHLDRLALIAIHFPVFTDGRGYSLARLLRQPATGASCARWATCCDQLYFLHACGFDAFSLRADQSPAEAVDALADYRWQPLGQR
jgi:uncharacterized protein (DUF934 family)